jgi:hypothetical protein
VTRTPYNNLRSPAAALLLALTAAGCAMTFDATSLGAPAVMASSVSQPAVGDTFNVTSRAVYLLWGLYPVTKLSLQNTLEGQLAGGRGVADLRIRVRRRWSDLLITVVTVGLVSPISVTFEGVVTPRPSP